MVLETAAVNPVASKHMFRPPPHPPNGEAQVEYQRAKHTSTLPTELERAVAASERLPGLPHATFIKRGLTRYGVV